MTPTCHGGMLSVAPVAGDALFDAPILIVEDVPSSRMLVRKILENQGYRAIEEAGNGQEALQKIAARPPDLVMLDIRMPEMDGYEFCRRLRALEEFHEVPILVQTALEDAKERNRIFECGASDMVIKPVSPVELAARVRVHLEHRLLVKGLAHYRAAMEEELETARAMQQHILPTEAQVEAIQSQYAMRIATYFSNSHHIGGDFWGMRALAPHKLAVYIVDFSGHGVTAALNTFRLHALLSGSSPLAENPGLYMAELNMRLCKLLSPGQYATMFHGVVDTRSHKLHYASAAPTAPVLVPARGGKPFLLGATGFMLGVVPEAAFPTRQAAFHPGDTLVLYSDAYTEAHNSKGAVLQESDVVKALSRNGSLSIPPAEAMLAKLLRRFEAHASHPLADDLTLCVFQRNP